MARIGGGEGGEEEESVGVDEDDDEEDGKEDEREHLRNSDGCERSVKYSKHGDASTRTVDCPISVKFASFLRITSGLFA